MKYEFIVLVVVAANAALWLCIKCLQVPLETLEIAGMLINFHSGKFGYSICHYFSKDHAKKIREFWHDLLKL